MTAKPPRVTLALIVSVVAADWGVDSHRLVRERRGGGLDDPRRAVVVLARELTSLTAHALGRLFGGRDHATILSIAETARGRLSDPHFCAMVERARETILKLAASREGERFRDADPVAAAERIMRHPAREALSASADAIVAMADRLLALEEAAACAFRLLSVLDALAAARAPASSSPARGGGRPREARWKGRECDLAAQARALTDTLASALAALGYDPTEETDDAPKSENEDGGPGAARAAE